MKEIWTKILGVFTGKAPELVNSITNLVDESKFSAEEKAAFAVKVQEVANKFAIDTATQAQTELDSVLKDLADARDTNVKIQDSDKASWLAKNVAYCIDVFVITVWGFLTIYLLCVMLSIVKKETGVDYTAVTAVWGGVTAFAGTIMNFHRGSSVGSKASNDTIRKMIEKQ